MPKRRTSLVFEFLYLTSIIRSLIKIYINMDKDKIHGFMDQVNLFFIGAVIGTIIGACFSVNVYKGKNNKAEEKVKAYEEYYKCTETLLDSLDGIHDLDLMDTDLETDYGADYLGAKSKVDELIAK
nr:MAG TPA: hypothetical protein [Caudoviricetes sp.]